MSMRQSLTVLAALLLVAAAQAQAPAEFTPPGPNIAFSKPYTLDPLPNYGDCSLDPDRKLLTDGQYTTGYFWVQKTTVGWVNKRPVAITIDLGQVQPIAGVTYNTAAGSADVAWPNQIVLMVSDDGKAWTPLGNLVVMSNKRDAPPAKPYRVHRFATDELQAHGRYVALVVDQAPYMVVDEIEVYGGKPEWLNQPLSGKQVTMSPLEYAKLSQVTECARARLRADLDAILTAAEKLPAADRAALQAQAERLTPEIEALDGLPNVTTILPLNDLHARIYALNAPVLRARGYRGMAVWSAYRYDPLQPLEAPEQAPTAPPVLDARMMRNERRAEVMNITNPGDGPLAVSIEVTGTGRRLVTPREVLFTDTLNRVRSCRLRQGASTS